MYIQAHLDDFGLEQSFDTMKSNLFFMLKARGELLKLTELCSKVVQVVHPLVKYISAVPGPYNSELHPFIP